MIPTLEGMLIVALIAFGVSWLDEGWRWGGGVSIFAAGTLFGVGLVRYKPWTVFRRRRP